MPALTIVAECSSADEGVGATMAPISQVEKGSCAALVSAAIATRPTQITAGTSPICAYSISLWKDTQFSYLAKYTIPTASAVPPSRFIHRALKELLTASSSFV